MIYTVTLNPAIDYVVELNSAINTKGINRNISEEIQFGGKGVNVSTMLRNLGYESIATGFIAGFTGYGLEDGIKKNGLNCDFVFVDKGFTRINVKIKADSEMEINGNGPDISCEDMDKLYKKLDKITDGDVLVLSGSVPKSLSEYTYANILERYKDRNILSIVDTTGNNLLNTLKFFPFLIKPNVHELEDIFHNTIENDEKIVECAKKMQEMGARNVLVSMAGDGALLLDEKNHVHRMQSPTGTVINSVGAGDSMVAGFIAGYLNSGDFTQALKLSVMAGSATAFSKGIAEKVPMFS